MALALFGVSGALANATGLIIGGVFGLIHQGGQMSGWRWFFRAIAMIRWVLKSTLSDLLVAFSLIPHGTWLQSRDVFLTRHLMSDRPRDGTINDFFVAQSYELIIASLSP